MTILIAFAIGLALGSALVWLVVARPRIKNEAELAGEYAWDEFYEHHAKPLEKINRFLEGDANKKRVIIAGLKHYCKQYGEKIKAQQAEIQHLSKVVAGDRALLFQLYYHTWAGLSLTTTTSMRELREIQGVFVASGLADQLHQRLQTEMHPAPDNGRAERNGNRIITLHP